MLVRDRMTTPAVTIDFASSLGDAANLLEARNVTAVPVTDAGRVVGLVSTTDVVTALSKDEGTGGGLDGDAVSALSVRALMSSPVVRVPPSATLDDAAREMVAARVHRLVVVDDDDHALGILSARDVLEEIKSRRIMNPIGSIMTTPVVTIDIWAGVDEAITRLAAATVHGLVVMDGSMAVGVFTHAEALAARRLPPAVRRGPVERVMSYETICIDVSTPIHRAAAYASSMNVRRLLIVERRELVGIVSCVDLIGVLARAAD